MTPIFLQNLSSRTRYLLGVFILVVANMGFSTKAVIIKLMYQYHVDTFGVIALRMLLSVPVYVAVAIYLARQKDNVPLTKKEWLSVSGLGILSYYVSSMLDFWGLQYISAGVERLILFTYPTMVLLLSAFFFKKKITPPQYIAMILTYIGVAIAYVAEKGVGEQKNVVLGASLIFTCAFTYSFFVVGTGELVKRLGSIKFTCYAMLAATVPALIQSYVHDGIDIFHLPQEVYHLSVLMAVVATVFPTFMIVEGIRLVGANNSGIIGFVGPVWTIFLANWLLGEPITLMQSVGTAIVLAGVFLISWKGKNI
ncbi:MAG: DMT family transporter [Saprospiraceae bacterium]|nr:DMT family transporter [Saprospiraceae bacterium]